MRSLFFLVLCVGATTYAQECGQKPEQPPWEPANISPFITFGRDSTVGAWPWQLSLQYDRLDDGVYSHTCGAVLIQTDWVLTAAHCVDAQIGGDDPGREDPARFQVVAGAHNLSDLTNGEQIRGFDLFVKHEDFIGDPILGPLLGFPADIAVLKLSEPLDVSVANIGEVCLPPQGEDFVGNLNCWITGWGKTSWNNNILPEILQEGGTIPPSVEECRQDHIGTILDSHICTGGGRPGACSGDSGGPYTCLLAGQWQVVGLAPWTNIFCDGLPAVYTRVTSYLDWIENAIQQN